MNELQWTHLKTNIERKKKLVTEKYNVIYKGSLVNKEKLSEMLLKSPNIYVKL